MGDKLTRRDFSAMLAGLGVGAALPALGRSAKSMPFKLGIITDEITQEFEQALDFISHYSLHYCELRDLWKINIMNSSRPDLDRAKGLIEKHRLHVSDIGSPIFKYNLPEIPAAPEKSDTFGASFTDKDSDRLLLKSFELAKFFGTRKVRIFAYSRVHPADLEKAYPIIRDRMARAAETAAKHGIILVLENEHTCNVGTGKELGRILRDVNSPNLRGNWDPGNATMLGEVPYPDGYREVRGLFAHMHAKDSMRDANGKMKWMPVGAGMVDWKGQIKALREDHYEGTLSLETHYRRPDGNRMESTRESLEGLLKIIHETA
ncbi:MAG TPA: sugar phosphate isomerase/epimerase family protein [Terriglobia bacterium]|nr:sugar phosphate isomerase/epimerase family protein [Terriglobia bacterium]